MTGTSLDPTYILMDGRAFFGLITPGFSILQTGYEAEDERLRGIADASRCTEGRRNNHNVMHTSNRRF